MSPRLDTLFGGWVDWFGGRQSARSIHFIVAWMLVAFVLIHVFEVIVTGLWNNLRSMITGRYRVPDAAKDRADELEVDADTTGARRRFLRGARRIARCAWLAGCDRLSQSEWFPKVLGLGRKAQRARRASWSPAARRWRRNSRRRTCRRRFAATAPRSRTIREYRGAGGQWLRRLSRSKSAGWSRQPRRFSLAELRALPSRTQITRHDCVEGWSAIGKWKGAQLSAVLDAVQPAAAARYVVFHCADPMDEDGESPYYESIDMDDAYHVQTMLAYELNDQPLPVANGAPIRLRVERQLGYKHAKYVMRLELVESFANIGDGKGGYWEDQGYQWYAGI